MALLILRDLDGLELGRRTMDEHERYDLYKLCGSGDLFRWGQGQFVVHTVAWRGPEALCIVSVTFDSWAPVEPTEPS